MSMTRYAKEKARGQVQLSGLGSQLSEEKAMSEMYSICQQSASTEVAQ